MYETPRLPGTSIPLATPVPPPHRMSADQDPVAMWNAFAGTLRRRWKLFASIVAGVIVAVALVTLMTPKTYTTSVKLIAGNPNAIAQNPQAQTALPFLNALMLAMPRSRRRRTRS